MFKDYDKYLSKTLQVYLFVLIIIFIMKIVGLDYFGLDVNNPLIVKVNNIIIQKWYFKDSINILILTIQLYFYLCIVCNKKDLYFFAFLGSALNYLVQVLLMYLNKMHFLYYLVSFLIMIFLPIVINRSFFIKRQLKYVFLLTFYQLLSLITRNVDVNYDYGNFVIDSLLNIDQIIMLAITYNYHFMEGVCKGCLVLEAGLSSLKKINLKNLLRKLQENWHKFKELDKVDKLSISIYIFFSLIWNTLSVVIILLVARINDTFIECLFILTSFWLSKTTFGKPFHLSSMTKCFIVSNLTYYVLNRITTPIGISILIPIMLGVGLSYLTSKLVKKNYKPLYRGMSEELFEETITQIVDKDSLKYKICYEFYIDKKTDIYLSMKYGYSVAGIRKIKDRINDKIRRLNS